MYVYVYIYIWIKRIYVYRLDVRDILPMMHDMYCL